LQIVGEHAITFFAESPFCTFCTQNLSLHRPWIISCLLIFCATCICQHAFVPRRQAQAIAS
jgi:hypothetical protein